MLQAGSAIRVLCNAIRPGSIAPVSNIGSNVACRLLPAHALNARAQSNQPVPADNRVEVFIDDIPVLVEPGTTVLQVCKIPPTNLLYLLVFNFVPFA